MSRRSLAAVFAVAFGLACTEDPTAPGLCPDFCPRGRITLVDTTLTSVVVRDSAFSGYVSAPGTPVLIAANVPGVIDSRPIVRFQTLGTTYTYGSDTVQHTILGSDSAFLALTFFRRDTTAGDLRVRLYRLPLALDSTTTFGDVAGPFTDSLVRTINVDSLVDLPSQRDTTTGDSVLVDSVSVRLIVKLDSSQARFVAADSGRLAFGVRIQTASPTSVVVGSNESQNPPVIGWHFQVDSAGTTTRGFRLLAPDFDSYVFDPPSAPFDSTLVIGGMPSSRSVVRIRLPAALQDSTQIIRATLLLVPASAAQGSPIDTFQLIANAVVADLGGKSPLLGASRAGDSSYFGVTPVALGSTDTVRIEITRILRRWAADTAAPNTIVLLSGSEGVVLSQIRFHSSRHATLRPAIRLTYAARFPFGSP